MTAFVLGNGISRQAIDNTALITLGTVYGCNALYRTFTPNVLIATDSPISKAIQESGYSKINRFYTRRPIDNLGALMIPKPYFGFSSGPAATAIAALDQHAQIYLLGFDLGPDTAGQFNNLYAGTEFYKPRGATPTFTGNWCKQLKIIAENFKSQQFYRVCGDTTARIDDLESIPNLKHLPIADFIARINTRKDL